MRLDSRRCVYALRCRWTCLSDLLQQETLTLIKLFKTEHDTYLSHNANA